jgi:hypothetical protein
MISRRGAKAQRNDTLSVSAPLREEETFLDNYITSQTVEMSRKVFFGTMRIACVFWTFWLNRLRPIRSESTVLY